MSHVCTVEIEVKDLKALAAAAKRIGCELVEGQQTYHWYGRSVGDYPLPAGFTTAELGKCEHAIRVKQQGGLKPGYERPYEIGVCRRKDGKPGYVLLWDFWNGGYGLQAKVGENAGLLRQAYATEVAKRQAMKQGFRVTEKTLADGKIQLVCSK